VARVIPLADLEKSPTAALFEGGKHGDGVPASMFVTNHPPGKGADLHFHPYAEVFFVREGLARFTVGNDEIEVGPDNFVVVPPETPHGFKNAGDGPLRLVSVHPSAELIQTWL
jgi:mannose-6-phosphate isomerase-like protein (cupin superfamily)